MSWVQTYSGRQFFFQNPSIDSIDIVDIAHSLSRNCRFNGHIIPEWYSVAEHSVLCSRHVAPQFALRALLHDCSEAYTGDIISDIKKTLPDFQRVENHLTDAINYKYGLPLDDPVAEEAVKLTDLRMLLTEKEQLMSPCKYPWSFPEGLEPYPIEIKCWSPERAKSEFLYRFKELYNG